ncbi:MAG: class I SAM-dependent methyltransferase [Spirochaetota bacterium]
MKPYHYLAPYYDYMLKHVDYANWYHYLRMIMCRYINNPRTVLELGCGTGKFGPKFSMDDYEIYGMDKSLEMLKIAKVRAYKNYHIFCGDITKFALSKTIDFIFSVHDTFNYLLDYDDFSSALHCVHSCMNNDSIFLFDLTTEYNIKKNFHNKLLTFQIKGTDIQWYNEYDAHSKILYSKLTFTMHNTTLKEEHLQRLYTIDEILPLIEQCGLTVVDIVGDYTLKPPYEETIMVNFITRRAQR